MPKKYVQIIRNNPLVIPALFLLMALAIMYFLPKSAKFRFEYKQGEPWLHENLIADFDFPIYKLPHQLNQEKKQVLATVEPIFYRDSSVLAEKIKKFRPDFSVWLKQQIAIKETDTAEILAFFTQKIQHIYERGILAYSEKTDVFKNKTIAVRFNQLVEKVRPDSLFSQKKAYQILLNSSDSLWNDSLFGARFHFEDYISPNLFFDEALTQKARQNALSQVSVTRGLVKKNERIVFRGEIVDEQTFMILESLRREYEANDISDSKKSFVLVGQTIFALLMMAILNIFMAFFRQDIYQSTKNIVLILVLFFIGYISSVLAQKSQIISIYLIPITIVPILLRVFFDARLALFVFTILSITIAYFAPDSYEYVVVQMVAGIIAVVSLHTFDRRSRLIVTSMLIIVGYLVSFLAFKILEINNLSEIQYIHLLWFVANGALVLLVYVLVYVFEKIFGFLSDISLLELTDINQTLLKNMSEQAPGTFQHSLQVANLAEEATRHINGNSLLIRAAALYHDIGKLNNPYYFTENQHRNNPHDELADNYQSAQIIINHVSSGTTLAKKNGLPQQLIDFIQTHHGTSLVRFFYAQQKAIDNKVDENKFRYNGPKPQTKEQAVLMMADSIEAASRSLANTEPENIAKLVNGIIESQLKDNQFDDSNITYKEIRILKEAFIRKLQSIYHRRISYPTEKKE